MELKDIKTGLFGFKKADVYEYISELNYVCADKIAKCDKDRHNDLENMSIKNEELNNAIVCLETDKDLLLRQIEEKDAVISELRAEICSLKESYKNDQGKRDTIADVIIEAKKFADELRTKAIAENEELQKKSRIAFEARKSELDEYSRKIASLKDAIVSTLTSMNNKTTDIDEMITVLQTVESEDNHE